MTPSEQRYLADLLEHHITELRKEFVAKKDFLTIVAQVDKHDDAYKDYLTSKKWLVRLGIATLLSAALSPHIKGIIDLIKMLF